MTVRHLPAALEVTVRNAAPRGGTTAMSGSGLANAEIARELVMSETTVQAHVSRSLAKLGLTNRVQIALLVRDAG
ncbi:response regulator transcription factor [Streptosporangium album]|uniref:response regulator transcription factor n=1 Tax=Streptosporangium album TaxID=47479 RepID=UPI003CD0B1D3